MNSTRTTRVSQVKAAMRGSDYTDRFLGMSATFTTWEGEVLVGTITRFASGMYPVVEFPDGTWARLDLTFSRVMFNGEVTP